MRLSKTLLQLTALLIPLTASAHWWESSFDLNLGYREDELSCLIDSYDPPGNLIFTDDLQITDIKVLEIGARGKCIACDTWLLKGHLFSGTIPHGSYLEVDKLPNGLKDTTKLRVHSGQTVDFSLGGGFLFPIFIGVRVGPTGGWSYNTQSVKMHGGGRVLNNLEYKNRWQGAWIGADALLTFCGFCVNAGYEYHNPHWSGYWLLKKGNQPCGSYSDVRKATKGYGNLVYFDASTTGLGFIRLDCQVKYQYWRMREGREHPKSASFTDVCLGKNTVDKIPRASWKSFEVTAGLGLEF